MNSTLETVTSADGTRIALERKGDGAPVILVGGAFNDRSTVAALAAALAPDITAVTYDRRGRGDSDNNDTGFVVEREFEDLAAVIGRVGGKASVFGHSSGAVLVIEAALHGVPIERLAVYEPSYMPEGTRPRPGADLYDRIVTLIGQDRRDDAVALFQTEAIGLPSEMVEGMRASDIWGWFTGLAHTLPYDVAVNRGYEPPAGRLATIKAPVLAIDGGESPDWIRAATRAVADAIPGARSITLEGQDHGVLHHPEALRPSLAEFFG